MEANQIAKLKGLSEIELNDDLIDEIYHLQTGSNLCENSSLGVHSGAWSYIHYINEMIHWLINQGYLFSNKEVPEIFGFLQSLEDLKDHFKKFSLSKKDQLEKINQSRLKYGEVPLREYDIPEII